MQIVKISTFEDQCSGVIISCDESSGKSIIIT